MQTDRGRALLACPDGREAAALAATLAERGYAPVTAADMASALDALPRQRYALAVTCAALPGGDGVALVRRMAALPLTRYPDALILCPEGLRLPGAARAAEYGAALLGPPWTADALSEAADRLREQFRPLPPEQAARLRGLLDRLGVPEHPGRDVLVRAVSLAWRDRNRLDNLKRDIYPDAGKPFGRTGAQAERALRHVIEAAWRDGAIEEQQQIFGDTIDARRGRPTCGEMIAHLADILRWEG